MVYDFLRWCCSTGSSRNWRLGGNCNGKMDSRSWCWCFICPGPALHVGNFSSQRSRSCCLVSSSSPLNYAFLNLNLSSCYQLFITIGIFTADCINYGTESRNDTGSYRIPMGVGWIWATILGVGIIFLPESPRHDFNHNNPARGRTTMSKFYGLPEDHVIINTECREIEQVMKLTAGDHPWYEAITGPRMLYRVALAMTLQMLQQLSGAVRFYFHHKVAF